MGVSPSFVRAESRTLSAGRDSGMVPSSECTDWSRQLPVLWVVHRNDIPVTTSDPPATLGVACRSDCLVPASPVPYVAYAKRHPIFHADNAVGPHLHMVCGVSKANGRDQLSY